MAAAGTRRRDRVRDLWGRILRRRRGRRERRKGRESEGREEGLEHELEGSVVVVVGLVMDNGEGVEIWVLMVWLLLLLLWRRDL